MRICRVWLVVPFFLLQAVAQDISSRKVDAAEFALEMSRQELKNATAEILISSGEVSKGKFDRIEGLTIFLRNQKTVSLCDVVSVRVTVNAASRPRRIAGMVFGTLGGMMIGGALGFAVGVSGGEAAALPIVIASPIAGFLIGRKVAAKNQSQLFYLERPVPDCSPAKAGNWRPKFKVVT